MPKSEPSYTDELDQLIQVVLDPDQNNVQAYAKLARMSDPYITTSLIQALSNMDSRIRVKAIWSLREIRDKQAIQPLIECLQDSDSEVRWSAANILGYFHDERAIQPLIQAINDPELNVRGTAIMALGELKNPLAVEALITVLPDVTEAAIEALVAIGDKRAIEPLIALLNDDNLTGYNAIRMRRKVVEALGDFGDPVAVNALVESLNDWDAEGLRVSFGSLPAFPSVCHYAAEALEKIGTLAAIEKVRQWRSTPFPNGGLRNS